MKIPGDYTKINKEASNEKRWHGTIYKDNKEIGSVTVNSTSELIKKYDEDRGENERSR
ncbi:MAG: hypothetical protein GY679_01990 [Mycoplasma sp.]|nr:hypothetical protein [Mycoplasma sp.]